MANQRVRVQSDTQDSQAARIRQRIVQVLGTLLFQAAVLLLAAGRLDWGAGWLYLGAYVAMLTVNAALLFRHNPGIIAERARAGPGTKSWDQLVGGLFALFYFLIMLIVAGLDERLDWTGPLPLWLILVGWAAFLAGSALFSWSMVTNAFFSTTVRIQEEREHAVVTAGPYQLVRHPGYLGAMLQSLGVPLLLGSLWALIPGGIAVGFLVVRTALEDNTLRAELVGYQQYAEKVRSRLIPMLW